MFMGIKKEEILERKKIMCYEYGWGTHDRGVLYMMRPVTVKSIISYNYYKVVK